MNTQKTTKKKFSRICRTIAVSGLLCVMVAGSTTTAFASRHRRNANVNTQTVEGQIGRSLCWSNYTAEDGKTWEEIHETMLAQKKKVLDERVANGELTQEEADAFIQRCYDHSGNGHSNCGNGKNGNGHGMGMGFRRSQQ